MARSGSTLQYQSALSHKGLGVALSQAGKLDWVCEISEYFGLGLC